MSEDGNTRGSRRYIALDIHKKYSVIGRSGSGGPGGAPWCGWSTQTWKAVPMPKTANKNGSVIPDPDRCFYRVGF